MSRSLSWLVVAGVLGCLAVSGLSAAEPKYTTKEIMKQGHVPPGKSLVARVIKGEASAEEKKLLVELYEALGQNEPPKGDKAEWQKLTKALLEAAKGVEAGDAGAGEKLNEAVQCGTCHKAHKA
jgi:hypothetical protein